MTLVLRLGGRLPLPLNYFGAAAAASAGSIRSFATQGNDIRKNRPPEHTLPPVTGTTSTPPSANIGANQMIKTNNRAKDGATSVAKDRQEKLQIHTSPGDGPKSKREQMRDNVKGYVFWRFFNYVKNYDKVLEKNFPSAVKVYRVFFDGVKYFYLDMKRYLKITRIVSDSPKGLKALNRQEVELYMQMPRDMYKVAPALIGCSMPMIGYGFLPLVFMYPRAFLTTHFWTLQQRAEFQQMDMKTRLNHNRPVFRSLQSKLATVCREEKYKKLQDIYGLLGSGFHPTVDMILDVKELFANPPYNLISLTRGHIKYLTRMHGLRGIFFKRHRLFEHAFLVHYMDLAILREGGVHNMPSDALRYSCFLRGLNPANLAHEEMVEWLRNWIKISTSIKQEHISLFLHLPLFLGYNHPNNWQLIYGSKAIWKTGSSSM